MSRSEPDATRIVRLWLEEGATALPDRVLDAVLDQLPVTPQRRPFRLAWRTPIMNNTVRLVAAAAAVVVVALIGYQLLVAPNVGGPDASPSPSLPAATAPPSGSAPGEFTACVPSNAASQEGTDETVVVQHPEGDMTVERRRGFTWAGNHTATDERFTGRHHYSWDGDSYTLASGDPGPTVASEGIRIENDQGAWEGGSTSVQLPDGTVAGGLMVLTGEGAYAGLQAVMFGTDGSCFLDWRGVVIEVPAIPVPYVSGTPPSPSASGEAAGSVPGEFTACIPSNSASQEGTDETVVVQHPDGDMTVERRRGYTWSGGTSATDERFSGRHHYSWDGDIYTLASGDPGPQVAAEGMRIENDQGAWQGGSTTVQLPDGTIAGGLMVLTGEGAYAGLQAVMFGTDGSCFLNWRGVVIEVPAVPVPYTGD
jgi:energy-converting hydrogenase Eha subunit A